MGYTHYWRQPVNKPFLTNEWEKICKGAEITFAKAMKGLYAGKESAGSAKAAKIGEPVKALAAIGIDLCFRTDFAEEGAWRTFPCEDIATPEYGKPIKLAGWDGTGKPEITDEFIAFNGKSPENYETFRLVRAPKQVKWAQDEDEIFSFCKTEYRPYDAVVVSILAIAQAVASDKISTDSDGGEKAIRYMF